MQLLFKRFAIICSILLGVLFIDGCEEPELGKILTEGKVEFDVTYPDIDSNNVLIKFMPDEMEMKFKDNIYKHEWVAGLGLFKTGYVADCNQTIMGYILKLINVKYKSTFDKDGISILNGNYPEYNFVPSTYTKLIAGYTCHEGIIEFPGKELPDFSVFYTTHLKITNPNWCNPLSKVPGVMLEYQLTKYNLTMKFTATSVIEEQIDINDFKIPSEFEAISNKRMEYKLKETFMSFQE